jgi:NAD kinase
MTKVGLFGKNSDSIRHLIPEYGLQFVDDKPDVIISYGGDGTLLSAERKYPSIPKLPIRDSKVCKKCSKHTTEFLLEQLSQDKINLKLYPKLEAKINDESILAINDIVIRNSTPMHALRFKLLRSGQQIKPDVIIGDGIVATTPFGSTGYYQSITRKAIESGFAVAFNNTTKDLEPLKFTPIQDIKVVIVRGPGSLSSDNNPKIYSLKEHDEIKIFASPHKAYIFIDPLRCDDCIILRDKRLR